MQNTQYELCCEVLRRLKNEGILKHMVLIGSWCLLAYEQMFKSVRYKSGIRTRDMDLLIPTPQRFDHEVDMAALLEDLDFVVSHKGSAGYMQFVHEELMIEFIVPERGRGRDTPYPIPALGINAQPLRFMDFLADHTVRGRIGTCSVSVPHPACFALLKLMISLRRTKSMKKENDRRQAVAVLRALQASKRQYEVKATLQGMPKTWQKKIKAAIDREPLLEIMDPTFN